MNEQLVICFEVAELAATTAIAPVNAAATSSKLTTRRRGRSDTTRAITATAAPVAANVAERVQASCPCGGSSLPYSPSHRPVWRIDSNGLGIALRLLETRA